MDINRITISGRLGAEPRSGEKNGRKWLSFSFASAIGSGDKKKTDWHKGLVTGNYATALGTLLYKGANVTIDGILRTQVRDLKDQKTRESYIDVRNLVLNSRQTKVQVDEPSEDEVPF